MARRYSLLKRFVQSVPGLREGLANAFTLLPKPFSAKAYAFLRRRVFRDNERRMETFSRAFDQVRGASPGEVNYFEFGVARGTSIIASWHMARAKGMKLRIFAFDSFAGLPSSESSFQKGDMAYTQRVFRRFIDKAGVPLKHVTAIPGYFNQSLTAELKRQLKVDPAAAVFHNDCDLYGSTRDVLEWIDSLAEPGSVLVFDDWFAFDHEAKPETFGEQRAFAEWACRNDWQLLYCEPSVNIAFVRTGRCLPASGNLH